MSPDCLVVCFVLSLEDFPWMRPPPSFSSEGSLPAASSSPQDWKRGFILFGQDEIKIEGTEIEKEEDEAPGNSGLVGLIFLSEHIQAHLMWQISQTICWPVGGSYNSYECKVKDLPPYCLHTNCTCTKIFTLLKTDLSQMCHLTFLQIK